MTTDRSFAWHPRSGTTMYNPLFHMTGFEGGRIFIRPFAAFVQKKMGMINDQELNLNQALLSGNK